MTIEELVDRFYHKLNGPDDATAADAMRVVVRALQDEFVTVFRREYLDDASIETFLSAQVVGMLDQILGDAGEKVGTHGSPELDEDARKLEAMGQDPGMTLEELLEPATDAAPAVCVWTGEEYVTYSTSCESEHEVDPHKAPPTYCPSCGKPIAFTEANHG